METQVVKYDVTEAALEADKKAEADRVAKIKLEEEAKTKAEKEAKEKVAKEAREKEETEERAAVEKARQEALRPDKERLLLFLEEVHNLSIGYPLGFKDEKVQFVCDAFIDIVQGQITKTKKEVEEL